MTMLTVKQSTPCAYKSVHDLPTPPSTSRPSPPLIYQDSYKPPAYTSRTHSPSRQLMSSQHRSLPGPAAMALPPQAPPPSSGPPAPVTTLGHHAPAHHPHQQGQPPPPPHQPPPPPQHSHAHGFGPLPPPPHHSDDALKSWLAAKAEEERRKQEEERTQQESLRLEQRRLEHDILKTSLSGGIPPPLVPMVFAGMGGGTLPQAALEWAQQFLGPQAPGHPMLMPPQGERRRDSQTQPYAPYQSSIPSTPSGTGQGQPSSYQLPTSPRGRGHTLSSMPQGHRPLGPVPPHMNTSLQQPQHHQQPGGPHQQPGVAHPEPQTSQILFHHWQPPATQGDGGSGHQAVPSVGEPPRKRKAAALQPSQGTPQQRHRSPPFSQHSQAGGFPPTSRGSRRGHQRQQSDMSSYASYRRSQAEGIPPSSRGASPSQASGEGEKPRSGGGHSVSSLLATEPPRGSQYPAAGDASKAQRRHSDDEEWREHRPRRQTGGGREG